MIRDQAELFRIARILRPRAGSASGVSPQLSKPLYDENEAMTQRPNILRTHVVVAKNI